MDDRLIKFISKTKKEIFENGELVDLKMLSHQKR
jgi:hypothetical protein